METTLQLFFVVQPVNLFWLTYSVTLILGVFFLAFSGFRQKYPLGSWVAITASVMVLFVIGLKFFVYTPAEWASIFMGTHHDIRYIKYVPGGILLVALGIPLLKRFLGFRASVFDGFVLFLPMLGVFQRVGCFMNGCCYGTHTELPWAVKYGWPSSLFYEQYNQGVLPFGQMHSLGVHPTQLYTIILSLGIIGILWCTRKWFKAPGSRTLFALILMGSMRFFLEFFREPRPGTWSNMHWLSLSLLQWVIIFLAILFAFVLWRRERLGLKIETAAQAPQDQPLRSIGVMLLFIFLVWQVREIFDGIELMIIYPVLFTSLVVLAAKVFHEITTPVSRMVLASMMVVVFISMGQTMVEAGQDSLASPNRGWFSLGTEGGIGAYESVTRDCNGNITGRYKNDFNVWGVSAAYHYMPRPDMHLQAGLKHFYLNRYRTTDQLYPYDIDYMHFLPYLRYDGGKFGAGVGLNFEFERMAAEPSEANSFRPSLYLRAGRRDNFFFEFDLGHPRSNAGEMGYLQTGIGLGITGMNHGVARIGFASGRSSPGLYLGADLLLGNRLNLNPTFTMSKYPTFSMGLQWHIGQNRWNPVNPEERSQK